MYKRSDRSNSFGTPAVRQRFIFAQQSSLGFRQFVEVGLTSHLSCCSIVLFVFIDTMIPLVITKPNGHNFRGGKRKGPNVAFKIEKAGKQSGPKQLNAEDMIVPMLLLIIISYSVRNINTHTGKV